MSELFKVSAATQPIEGSVIFVHGLGGDAYDTWWDKKLNKKKESLSWPFWVSDEFKSINVYTLSYEASPSEWLGGSMPLLDRSKNILDLLQVNEIEKFPIVFITHSLGGLLVKQVLRDGRDKGIGEWDKIVNQIRGIIFLSTPHTGANLANWLSHLGTLLRASSLIEDLRKNEPLLRDLNIWYRNNSQKLGIETISFYEKRKTYGVLVVDETSADPGIAGTVPIPLDDDHVSICRPSSRDSHVYKRVNQFINVCLSKTEANQLHSKNSATQNDPDELKLSMGICDDQETNKKQANRNTPPSMRRGPRELWYEIMTDPDHLKIISKLEYYDVFSSGGLIRDFNFWEGLPFKEEPVTLDIKITNNNNYTVYFNKVIIEVEQSVKRTSPLLVFKADSLLEHAGKAMLKNEGWSTVKDLVLDFDIRPVKIDDGFQATAHELSELMKDDCEGKIWSDRVKNVHPCSSNNEDIGNLTDYKYRMKIQEVSDSVLIDFQEFLEKEGIEILRKRGRAAVSNLPINPARKKILSAEYKCGFAVAEGKLTFSSLVNGSLEQRHTVKFSVVISLEDEWRSGAYMESTATYDAELSSEGHNYQIEVPISQQLRCREIDRFFLRIWVNESSDHIFRLRLIYNHNLELTSPTINMNYFISKTRSKSMYR